MAAVAVRGSVSAEVVALIVVVVRPPRGLAGGVSVFGPVPGIPRRILLVMAGVVPNRDL